MSGVILKKLGHYILPSQAGRTSVPGAVYGAPLMETWHLISSLTAARK